MSTENSIAKTVMTEDQGTEKQEMSAFYGRPIASNDIDNPDDLMGYID